MVENNLERTMEAQRGFDGMRTRITVVDGADGLTPDMLRRRESNRDQFIAHVQNGAAMDPFDDDEPIVASCDLANPESCESCT